MAWTEEVVRFFNNLTNRPGSAGWGWNVSSVPGTDSPTATQIGAVTETAPASDTASSGLNGRLQRIAQRLTTIITSGLRLITDVGRVSLQQYSNNTAVGATTVETAMTMNISSGVTAVTAGVSYTIPNGKTLRIKYLAFASTANAVGAIASTVFSLRLNAAGAVVVGSTPVLIQRTLAHPAVNSDFKQVDIQNMELDIVGDGTTSIGITTNATYAAGAPVVGATLTGYLFTT